MYLLADTATWIGVGSRSGRRSLALVASVVLLVVVLQAAGGESAAGRSPKKRRRPWAAELALVEARVESERSRRLSGIATTIDLDAVLERTLEAAVATDGIDAAMAVIRQSEESRSSRPSA